MCGVFFFCYDCSCTSKYVGEYCQFPNPCTTGSEPRCQNGGSCEVRTTALSSPTFLCNCPIGFTESLCEIRVPNACDSGPCMNGGTCNLKSLEEYTCTCAVGYRGKEPTGGLALAEWSVYSWWLFLQARIAS